MKRDQIKILPIGGQAELGKSMYCIEINNSIFIIDAGHRFPDLDKLGVDIIIPSFDYLSERKNDIAAIIITHAHDDVMAALPYLLKEVGDVPVYAPALTVDLIEQMIEHFERSTKTSLNINLNRVKRDASIEIAGRNIEFFPITHSIPGTVGVAIDTSEGYIVYGSEFIIDFGALEGFKCNLQKMLEIGKKGVLALMVESTYAKKEGYTSPNHKLTNKIEHLFEEASGRIIISSYAQNVFRTQEIVELTKKYHRQIVFYGRDKYDKTNSILRIGKTMRKPVIEVPLKNLGSKENVGNPVKDRNYVILLSGAPHTIYTDISDILDGGDDLKLRKGDTFIVASPVLPGTEKIAVKVHNDLYKSEADKIAILKNKDLQSMHASSEDIKVLIQMFNPRYFIPIKGEYQHFIANANVAKSMNIDDDHIIIIDNGEEITFDKGKLLDDRHVIDIEDVMVDGSGIGDVGEKVIDDRIQLSNDGVVVVGITIDRHTKEIIAQTDCQTRGFVYLKDSQYIIKKIIELCEEEVAKLKLNPYKDMQEVRNAMRDASMKYIMKEIGKKPVFISVVIEV